MKKLYILKVGSTFPAVAAELGDFDRWTIDALNTAGLQSQDIVVLNMEDGAVLPPIASCAGVIITGSHSMVTDELPWSLTIEKWIPALLVARIPLLGICYGHQLLAKAGGGEVGFHPAGKEVGTRKIQLLPTASDDLLFESLTDFYAHTTHAQTVLKLPPYAVRLAVNLHEPNHAFRLGECAWGVQFHPEYTPAIMSAYIEAQRASLATQGQDVDQLLAEVTATPTATKILTRFGALVEKHKH